MTNLKQRIASTFGFLRTRKRAYQLALRSPAGQEVLHDLLRFCRGAETAAVPGDRDKTMMLLGRQEVWLRIQQHLNLTEQELFQLYAGNGIQIVAEENSNE